ncbi:hypothetical protein [Streptomyces sp. CB03234]|uniref:hypothetical protein n=1 Tax=Streptomyces sp. (strain CB03234) TaxID=1703937 RepID=UPI0009A1E3B2|nr:hypothetical protein [Streptomyces sp. CB03234]
MSPTLRTALCPVVPPGPGRRPPSRPHPEGLAYSLTVPGELRSAAVVRNAVRATLHAHGLDRFLPPAQLAASELVGAAARLTPGEGVYLSLRYRQDALRLVVWDQHPRHRDPVAEALCARRRDRALWLLAAVVDDWGGEWGLCEAAPPHRGTKSWVVLPR